MRDRSGGKSRRGGWVRAGLVVLSSIVTLGVLPIILGWGGLADRVSFLPGVSERGGVVSALSYILFLGAVAGVALGGVYVSGGEFPINGDEPSGSAAGTPTSAPTTTALATTQPADTATTPASPDRDPTPTQTPTPTATPTLTPTPTATPEANALNYRPFALQFIRQVEARLSYPIGAKAFITDYENATLWAVINGTNKAENGTRALDERMLIAEAYAVTLNVHDHHDIEGDVPLRLRFVDWNETTQTTPAYTFFVDNYDAWAWINGTISYSEFTNRWLRSTHPAPAWVEQKARKGAVNLGNITLEPMNESKSETAAASPALPDEYGQEPSQPGTKVPPVPASNEAEKERSSPRSIQKSRRLS